LSCGDHVSGGNKEYVATSSVSQVDYIISLVMASKYHLGNCAIGNGEVLLTSGDNHANGSTTFRVSVMGVPVGEATCDSSVSNYGNAILGGAHVDIASKTLPMRDWETYFFI
jgi:hypothetical protein